MSPVQFSRFTELVHKLTGVTIAPSRQSMLRARIGSRMRALGEEDIQNYYCRVLEDPIECALFVDKVTTHETRFFRTPRIWEYLRNQFVPEVMDRGEKCSLRAWSAASSTGEEAYSLAMLLEERVRNRPDETYFIDASDISEQVIERCQAGVYSGRNAERLSQSHAKLLTEYFQETSNGYSVRSKLKANVRFYAHNLFDSPKKTGVYDLVLLRNVLIYFSEEDQVRVLTRVRESLRNDGLLVIGESESIPPHVESFSSVEPFIYRATPQ